MSSKLLALIVPALLAAPAVAQTAPPPGSAQDLYQKGLEDKGSPNMPPNSPYTTRLNSGVVAAHDARTSTGMSDQAQYNADRQAYMDALARHDAAVDRTDARYIRQQGAYADAMTAWRGQVRACKKGYKRACNAPTPNPADFYDRP